MFRVKQKTVEQKMNYTLSRTDECTVIEVSGKIDGGIVMSAGSLVRRMGITYPGTVILDIDGLEDQREMFYNVALINSFKKEIEQRGGKLKLRATRLPVTRYLTMTGLKKLFTFDETAKLAEAGA